MNWIDYFLLFAVAVGVTGACAIIYAYLVRGEDDEQEKDRREVDRLIRECDRAIEKRPHVRAISTPKEIRK